MTADRPQDRPAQRPLGLSCHIVVADAAAVGFDHRVFGATERLPRVETS